MAPAEVAEMPSNSNRSSASNRSSTPQVKAPWAPPPCKARLRRLVARLACRLARGLSPLVNLVAVFIIVSYPAGSFSSVASMRRPAAIDRQSGTGDRGGVIAAQERHQGADFRGLGEGLVRLLGQQDVADDLVAIDAMGLGLVLDLLLDQWRPDVAGANGIGAEHGLGRVKDGA